MSLYFWDLDPFHNTLQRPFGNPQQRPASALDTKAACQRELVTWRPNVDVKETDKEFIMHVEAPGVAEKNISVNVEDGVLTVSGKREATKKEENERYHHVERSVGSFSRSMHLPEGVDPTKVTASFDNGVLEVCVPKPEAPQPRKISINVGSSKALAVTALESPAVQLAQPAPALEQTEERKPSA